MHDIIRDRLEDLGMTRRELREALEDRGVHVSRQTIYAWCTGRALPRLEHVSPLCDALRLSPWERARLLDAAAEGVGRG
jgi:DNA-binding XRE family transcriptional regulator